MINISCLLHYLEHNTIKILDESYKFIYLLQNDLCDKRLNLSILLIDLLEQQKQRRAQLISTLQTIEEQNNQSTEDFWLRQYQGLLERYGIKFITDFVLVILFLDYLKVCPMLKKILTTHWLKHFS